MEIAGACFLTLVLGPRERGGTRAPGANYWSSFRTFCWLWLAWASIAVDAWLRICALARLVVSAEKSASWIWLCALVRFVASVVRLLTADCIEFCAAPKPA